MVGGLTVSGGHTSAMAMRLLVDNLPSESVATGAVGVDELRWGTPVGPGDTLVVETEVLDTAPREGPLGLVRSGTTTLNQDDVSVMTMGGLGRYERRAPQARSTSPRAAVSRSAVAATAARTG